MAQWVGTAVLPAPLYSAQSMSIAIKHANNTLLHLRQQQGKSKSLIVRFNSFNFSNEKIVITIENNNNTINKIISFICIYINNL